MQLEQPYQEMLGPILQHALDRFKGKAEDYSLTFKDLGVMGQYSDMHRKMKKLKRVLWDHKTLKGEQEEEILEDLIGNCLITLWLLENEDQIEHDTRPAVPAAEDDGLTS
jgi:hypothetical protein